MTSINKFDSNVYSDELHSVSESEYDDVMQMMADESEGFQGYAEWSSGLDIVNESENFYVTADNKVHYKGANLKSKREGGLEV